jgi:isopenicillin N synthase-like dioxygenase
MVAAHIPVVRLADYTDGDSDRRAAFVRTYGEALETFGFVSVTDHGVDSQAIRDVYADIAQVFALPQAEKDACTLAESHGNRGYIAFGKEHAKTRPVGDLKEFWHVGRPIPSLGAGGRNAFPGAVPAFEGDALALFQKLEHAAFAMLSALADYLGEPTDTFVSMAREGNSILRLIHYPPIGDDAPAGGVRAAEHEDINLLTLLCESTGAGLEILTKDGSWLAVEAPPGHLVVDTGDMMARLTGGKIPSITHRVVNPPDERRDLPRYSLPFFVHPRPEVVLARVPTCRAAAGTSDTELPPITADAFLRERLAAIGLTKRS